MEPTKQHLLLNPPAKSKESLYHIILVFRAGEWVVRRERSKKSLPEIVFYLQAGIILRFLCSITSVLFVNLRSWGAAENFINI